MPTSLSYDVFIADPIPQDVAELVPKGDKRMFSPLSFTLIYGCQGETKSATCPALARRSSPHGLGVLG
jgi:hypothetical protein